MQLKTVLFRLLVVIATFGVVVFLLSGGCQLSAQEKEAPEKPKAVTKTTDAKGVTEYRADDAVLKAIREKAAEPKEKRLSEMTKIEYKLWLSEKLDDFRERIKELPAKPRIAELNKTGLLRTSRIDSFVSPTLVGFVLDVPQETGIVGGEEQVIKDREIYFLATTHHKMIDTWHHMLRVEGHDPKISIKGHLVLSGGTVSPSIFVVETMSLVSFESRW